MKQLWIVCAALLAASACSKEDERKKMHEEATEIIYQRLHVNKLNDSTVAFTNTEDRPLFITNIYAHDGIKSYQNIIRDTLAGLETVNYTWSIDQGRTIKGINCYFQFKEQYSNVTFDYAIYEKSF